MRRFKLLEFGIGNFLSFKEGATISFRLDSNCPESISLRQGYTTVLCVKGANGSGKTTVLKALTFLAYFCGHSFARDPDAAIGLDPFFESKEPCRFFVDFAVGGTEYRYELEATDSVVRRETLYRTISRQSKVLERVDNAVTVATGAYKQLLDMKLRRNASIVSTAHQYELPQLNEVRDFFIHCTSNVNADGLNERALSMPLAARYLQHKPEVFGFVKQFISDCDVGVSDIRIADRDVGDGRKDYYPLFAHEANGVRHEVGESAESHGTKVLFRVLPLYANALQHGGVVALDEFDAYLHPMILVKLVDMFLSEDTNPRGAQLIFSTHATEVLNHLGRYRSYLVNKVENESFAYRLDEIPGDVLRNDRPIVPAYLEGKIGGVPRLS